jgi:hypothetical protein
MYLGARIIHSLLRDKEYAHLAGYLPWLERLDQLCLSAHNDNILDDLVMRFSGALEVSSPFLE